MKFGTGVDFCIVAGKRAYESPDDDDDDDGKQSLPRMDTRNIKGYTSAMLLGFQGLLENRRLGRWEGR